MRIMYLPSLHSDQEVALISVPDNLNDEEALAFVDSEIAALKVLHYPTGLNWETVEEHLVLRGFQTIHAITGPYYDQ